MKIEIISGLHRKAPAAILMSTPTQPTLCCLQKLLAQLSCRYFAPLFTVIDNPAQWQQALNCHIITHPTIEMELCQ